MSKAKKPEDKKATIKDIKKYTSTLENHARFTQNITMAMARACKITPKKFANHIKDDVANDEYQIKIMELLGYKLTSGNKESKHHPSKK